MATRRQKRGRVLFRTIRSHNLSMQRTHRFKEGARRDGGDRSRRQIVKDSNKSGQGKEGTGKGDDCDQLSLPTTLPWPADGILTCNLSETMPSCCRLCSKHAARILSMPRSRILPGTRKTAKTLPDSVRGTQSQRGRDTKPRTRILF